MGEFTSNYAKYLVYGSISQRHGSADPDPDPDPPQNVMNPVIFVITNLCYSVNCYCFFEANFVLKSN
jgi:hypothetical protein